MCRRGKEERMKDKKKKRKAKEKKTRIMKIKKKGNPTREKLRVREQW